MIRVFFWFLIALCLGGLLAMWMGDDNGIVMVNFKGYVIETSLLSLCVILLTGFAVFYVLLWLLSRLNPLRLFSGAGLFLSRRQAIQGTEKGFVALAEKRWQNAYRLLVSNAGKSPTPLVNYLGAAEAALSLQDEKGMRFCLREALQLSPDADIMDGLLTARLEESRGQLEAACRRLRALYLRHDSHVGILRQLSSYYVRLGSWEDVTVLLPRLKALEVLPAAEWQALQRRAWQECLQQFVTAQADITALNHLWDRIPSTLHKDPAILGIHVQKLTEMGADDKAQNLLLKHFRQHQSPDLLLMLGYLNSSHPKKLLAFLEKLALEQPDNATLRLTLGRVCLRNALWGKARDQFEQALRLATGEPLLSEAAAELARLYDALDQPQLGAESTRKALGAVRSKLPVLPMPDVDRRL